MSKIGTNQMAVNAQKAQQQIQRNMTKIMEKLSTGQKLINQMTIRLVYQFPLK